MRTLPTDCVAGLSQKAPTAEPIQQPATPAATKSVTEVASVNSDAVSPEGTGIGKYRWPARGAVIANFGGNIDGKRSDGIAISVPSGTPIKAAENGVVIYAGNQLRSYGNLLLVRHPSGYVTAYAHNEKLLVNVSDEVKRGQKIALVGKSGSVEVPQLHFEIRRGDKPVNPADYLVTATASR